MCKSRSTADGLGSLAEEIVLAGEFFVPKEQKIADFGQEQLLLHAPVEELVRRDLALRENANDGRYLVRPSRFNRDCEDPPEPKGKEVAITFDGPVRSLYSMLAVRLGHSGLFTTGRAEMWRTAAVSTARAGAQYGLFLHSLRIDGVAWIPRQGVKGRRDGGRNAGKIVSPRPGRCDKDEATLNT